MTNWTDEQLTAIENATELYVSTTRPDGSLRNALPIWHVRVADGLYIRSAHGPENGWFRRALSNRRGHISSGGVEADVTFEPADAGANEAITAAYHAKYDRYGPGPVGAVTGDDVDETTLRLTPARR